MSLRFLAWIGVGLLACFLGGLLLGESRGSRTAVLTTTSATSATSHTEERASSHVVVAGKHVSHTHITTREPDGTTTETESTAEDDATSDETTAEVESASTAAHTENSSSTATTREGTGGRDYSLGVGYQFPVPSYADLLALSRPTWEQVEVRLGYRLVGDAWVEGGYTPGRSQFSLGIRWEF